MTIPRAWIAWSDAYIASALARARVCSSMTLRSLSALQQRGGVEPGLFEPLALGLGGLQLAVELDDARVVGGVLGEQLVQLGAPLLHALEVALEALHGAAGVAQDGALSLGRLLRSRGRRRLCGGA